MKVLRMCYDIQGPGGGGPPGTPIMPSPQGKVTKEIWTEVYFLIGKLHQSKKLWFYFFSVTFSHLGGGGLQKRHFQLVDLLGYWKEIKSTVFLYRFCIIQIKVENIGWMWIVKGDKSCYDWKKHICTSRKRTEPVVYMILWTKYVDRYFNA